MNNIAPKLRKRWTHKIVFSIISKMLKEPNYFYSLPSTLPKDAPTKFYNFLFKFYDKFYPIIDFLRIFNHQNRKP